jgi:quercetin dioxygenase-like cupin family protein
MARFGDFYANTVTGERAVVLRDDEESLLVHLTVAPGGFVAGEHIHPAMTERFHVLSGRLETKVAGVERALWAGDEVTVKTGTPHDWWNAGASSAEVIVELTPPNPRFETMIAMGFGLANAGLTDAKGRAGLLQLALLAVEFSDVIQFTSPPRWLQRAMFAPLAFVARRRGYRAIYPEYLGPHGRVAPDVLALAAAGSTISVWNTSTS